jgi:hypothetical protein
MTTRSLKKIKNNFFSFNFCGNFPRSKFFFVSYYSTTSTTSTSSKFNSKFNSNSNSESVSKSKEIEASFSELSVKYINVISQKYPLMTKQFIWEQFFTSGKACKLTFPLLIFCFCEFPQLFEGKFKGFSVSSNSLQELKQKHPNFDVLQNTYNYMLRTEGAIDEFIRNLSEDNYILVTLQVFIEDITLLKEKGKITAITKDLTNIKSKLNSFFQTYLLAFTINQISKTTWFEDLTTQVQVPISKFNYMFTYAVNDSSFAMEKNSVSSNGSLEGLSTYISWGVKHYRNEIFLQMVKDIEFFDKNNNIELDKFFSPFDFSLFEKVFSVQLKNKNYRQKTKKKDDSHSYKHTYISLLLMIYHSEKSGKGFIKYLTLDQNKQLKRYLKELFLYFRYLSLIQRTIQKSKITNDNLSILLEQQTTTNYITLPLLHELEANLSESNSKKIIMLLNEATYSLQKLLLSKVSILSKC